MNILIQFFILVLISFLLIKSLLPFLTKYLIDNPNKRSSHIKPTPNGGGLIIASLGILYLSSINLFFVIYCIPLAIVSFIDDFIKVNYKIRLLIQGFTVSCIYYNSNLYNLNSGNTIFLNAFISFGIVFIGTGLINFINFMDGLDGLLASSMTIIIGVIALKTNIDIFPFIGIIIGFLILNWPPAKIFMGDVGSTFIAAIFIGLIFESDQLSDSISKLVIATPILGDAIFTILARFINGQTLFKPHRLHLFQRLNIAGWSHLKVTVLYSFMSLILAIIYYQFGILALISAAFIELIIGFTLNYFCAIPIKKDSKKKL